MRHWLRWISALLCASLMLSGAANAAAAKKQDSGKTAQTQQADPEAEALRTAVEATAKSAAEAKQQAETARAAAQSAMDASARASAAWQKALSEARSALTDARQANRDTGSKEILKAQRQAESAAQLVQAAADAYEKAEAAARSAEKSARFLSRAEAAASGASYSAQAQAVAAEAAVMAQSAAASAQAAADAAGEAKAAADAAEKMYRSSHACAVAENAKQYFFQAPKQIKITFVGDCTLGNSPRDREFYRDVSFEGYIEKYGLQYPFENVQDLFDCDDLTVINLEGIFYDSESGRVSKTYNFRTATQNARMLNLCSIEAASIGNNHSMDYGAAGIQASTQTLDGLGVNWFGVNEGANRVYIYEKDGVKIGFASIYYGYWAAGGNNVKKMEKNYADLRAAGCQVIVGCIHCGVDYDPIHDNHQERMAKKMISMGADVVIGTGPHCIQGMRVENGITTLWSLGNFSFGGNRNFNNKNDGTLSIESLLAQITFSFDENNKYLGHQLNIFPAYSSGSTKANNFQPVLVTGDTAKKVMACVQRDCKSIRLKPYREEMGAIQEFVPAK